jgi:hypothetical protein
LDQITPDGASGQWARRRTDRSGAAEGLTRMIGSEQGK